MKHNFEQHVRDIFDAAAKAAEMASAARELPGPNSQQGTRRGEADLVVRDASKRLLTALGNVTQLTEIETGLWVVGDFTRWAADSALSVKEAAVDAALSVFTGGIDEADGRFFAPSWVE